MRKAKKLNSETRPVDASVCDPTQLTQLFRRNLTDFLVFGRCLVRDLATRLGDTEMGVGGSGFRDTACRLLGALGPIVGDNPGLIHDVLDAMEEAAGHAPGGR